MFILSDLCSTGSYRTEGTVTRCYVLLRCTTKAGQQHQRVAGGNTRRPGDCGCCRSTATFRQEVQKEEMRQLFMADGSTVKAILVKVCRRGQRLQAWFFFFFFIVIVTGCTVYGRPTESLLLLCDFKHPCVLEVYVYWWRYCCLKAENVDF